jgi:hypothetical protein
MNIFVDCQPDMHTQGLLERAFGVWPGRIYVYMYIDGNTSFNHSYRVIIHGI